MKRYVVALYAVSASAILVPFNAWSQSVPAGDSGGALEEVVVTAEKREESAQKTPISMEIYGAQQLAQQDVTDMASLAKIDTSLNFTSGAGEGFLTMRGVSSSDTTEIGSPSVPVVVDDFSSNRSWSLQASMFDLERVEVLRGPQGTLYGHSATGGLINVVTQKPTNQFEADASVEYGNYDTINTTGTLNIPVSDTFQLRAAFSDRKHDGYRGIPYDENGEPVDQRADDEDSRAARLTLAFEPVDAFKALVSYELTQIGGLGEAVESIPFNYVGCASYLSPCAATSDIYHTKPNLGNTTTFPIYGEPWQQIKDNVLRWNFAYSDLPFGATVTYLGGFGLEEWNHMGGGSTTLSFLGNPALANGYLPARQYDQDEEPHTQTHEVRLTSAATGPFTWQGGLYYFEERNNLFSHTVLDAGAADAATELEFIFPEVRQTSRAVYGQGSYQLNDTNKITAGVRYNEDDLVRTGVFNLIFAGEYGISEYGHASSNRTTWHLGYDWTPTAANLLYAKADSGYKPGGFTTCGTYNPEDVTTGEIGSKNRFNDGRIQLNGAVFYDVYKNQQVAQFTASCISGTNVTNAGESRIYGLESELTALTGQVGQVDLNLSYLHARFVQFLVPPTIGPAALVDCARVQTTVAGSNCNLAGNVLPRSPAWTLSASYEHDWHLPQDAGLNFRLQGKYTTKQYFDSFNFEDTEQVAYATADAYLTYVQNKYQLGLYIRNLTNYNYLTGAAEATGGGSTEYQYTWGAPRTYGARIEVSLH